MAGILVGLWVISWDLAYFLFPPPPPITCYYYCFLTRLQENLLGIGASCGGPCLGKEGVGVARCPISSLFSAIRRIQPVCICVYTCIGTCRSVFKCQNGIALSYSVWNRVNVAPWKCFAKAKIASRSWVIRWAQPPVILWSQIPPGKGRYLIERGKTNT